MANKFLTACTKKSESVSLKKQIASVITMKAEFKFPSRLIFKTRTNKTTIPV